MALGGLEVDLVDADAVPRDDAEPGRPGEHGSVYLVEPGEQSVRVGDLLCELAGRERAGPVADLADLALQLLAQPGVVHAERARRHNDDAVANGARCDLSGGHRGAHLSSGPPGVRNTRCVKPVCSIEP